MSKYTYEKPSGLYIPFAAIVASCHKKENTPQPTPAPVKDSAQHALDSIQHFNDSVAHYQDSISVLVRFYFGRIRGTRAWDGHRSVHFPSGDSTNYYFTDSLVTVGYGDVDTNKLSINVAGIVFPADSLKELTNDRIVISKEVVTWQRANYYFTYYIAADSMVYSDYIISGHGYLYKDWHTH